MAIAVAAGAAQAVLGATPLAEPARQAFDRLLNRLHSRVQHVDLRGQHDRWYIRAIAQTQCEPDVFVTVLKGLNQGQSFRIVYRKNAAEDSERKVDPLCIAIVDRAVLLTARLRWLARKGERGGFELMGSLEPGPDRVCHAGPTITHRIYRTPPRARRRTDCPITIHGCDFTGHLRVTDAQAFAHTRARGIGKAKAFGFSLLMVVPS